MKKGWVWLVVGLVVVGVVAVGVVGRSQELINNKPGLAPARLPTPTAQMPDAYQLIKLTG